MVWVPQTSFRNGEVSPHVDAQARPKVYETSCRNLEGGIVSSGGSIEKRCGTVHEATTGGTGEGTYTSTAIKLIPYTHLSSQYVIVFEVVTANGKTWGIVTAVLNNTHPGAGSPNMMFTDHGETWLANRGCNLPFSAHPFSEASAATDFIPLGVEPTGAQKNLFRSCGLHPFTAAQIEEVQYFQHEDSLILCHSEVHPFELFLSRSKGGVTTFDTRPYDCVDRSPPVDIKGQRFTLDIEPGTIWNSTYGRNYFMVTNHDWFTQGDKGHIYRIGHCSSAATATATSTTGSHSSLATTTTNESRHGFFVRVREVESTRRVKVENITDLSINERTFRADISDPNDWDGPWVRQDQGSLVFSHTVRGTKATGTLVAGLGKAEMHLSAISLTQSATEASMNIQESSLVGCIISKTSTSNAAHEGYAIITAPSAKADPEGDLGYAIGSDDNVHQILDFNNTPFLASCINGDVEGLWQTAASGLRTPRVSRRIKVYKIVDQNHTSTHDKTLGNIVATIGDTIIFRNTSGAEIGSAKFRGAGTWGISNQQSHFMTYTDPTEEVLTMGGGSPWSAMGPPSAYGTVENYSAAPNEVQHDYTRFVGTGWDNTSNLGGGRNARSSYIIGTGNADLYRLVNRNGYERTLSWTHQIGRHETDSLTDGYHTPNVGDKVFIHIGNTERVDTANVVESSSHESIPLGHEAVFDTMTRGDLDRIDPFNEPRVGGVVHLNGGTFALSLKKQSDPNVVVSSEDYRLYYHAYVITPPINQTITSKYSLGWSEGIGFPTCGTSHQGRVYFSGFKRSPQVVVGSSAPSAYDFSLGGTSPDAMHFLVNDMRGSMVRWMSSGTDLMLGTTSGEFAIGGTPLSPTSVGVQRHSAYGSSAVRPVIAGTYIFYIQKDMRTIRAQRYRFENQRYISLNITEDHRHLFKGRTIKEMVVWEGDEDPVVLVRMSDGEVLACRVNEQEGTFGWSRMKLPLCAAISPARHYNTLGTSNATTGDDFYIATQSTGPVTDPSYPPYLTNVPAVDDPAIDGTGKYHLSRYDCDVYLDQSYTPDGSIANPLPQDNLLYVPDGHPLRGQTVHVIADGLYKGTVLVASNGAVDFNDSMGTTATNATVGLAIPFSVTPRVPEVVTGIRVTSTLGRMKNYSSVVVNVNGSKGVQVNGLEIDGIPLDLTSNQITPHTEHTGWTECVATGLYGIQPLLVISSDRPYPVELCGYTVDMSVEG